MSDRYLVQARFLLIQKLAEKIVALDDALNMAICSLDSFDYNTATSTLHILENRWSSQKRHEVRPISPTDSLQYDGINSSSITCLRSLRLPTSS